MVGRPQGVPAPARWAEALHQGGQHGVGAPQVLDRRKGWAQSWPSGSPSTAPGTPVLVEYFGWIFMSGRM